MKLQLALDDITLDEAVVLLDKVHPYVDIIEVGSPFIIEEGMRPVRIFKEKYPDCEILADTKIMDAGEYEAEETFKAGADYCTVLGVTDTLTIEGTAIDFNKEIYEYSVTVPYEYSSVNVYAFPESDNAFAEVEGDRGLKVGANNLKITVKNGKLTKTYTITVIRKEAGLEISNDVTLSSLTVKGYGIDFSPEKLDYTIKIKREKSLIITATPTSNRSEVYMYGNNSLTGFSTVRIKVVAENGATNIYSIDIQKDSYNKVLEITAVIIGSVIILGTGIIIVVRKKNKKMKEYLGK